jgi:TetR/AcrR family transcriptional regulator, cholesterol catabolism regulator
MEVNEKLTEVKEKVLKEAQSMFWRYGVKSVTMDDIARHLGMSKKTLYQFFTDKDDLICQVMMNFLKKEESEIEGIYNAAKNSVEGMLLMSKHLKISFQNITPSLLFELRKYHPKAYKIFTNHKHSYLHRSVVQNLDAGIKEGVFREDIDLKVLAKLRLEQIEMGFDQEIFPSADFKLEHVQLQLFDHFIHGITTLKGHKLLNQYRKIHEEEN